MSDRPNRREWVLDALQQYEGRLLRYAQRLTGDLDQNQAQLREAGADQVETNLLETCNHLNEWLPVLTPEDLEHRRRARLDQPTVSTSSRDSGPCGQ